MTSRLAGASVEMLMTLLVLALTLASQSPAAAQPSPEEAARSLVPVLRDVRRSLEPRLTVERGALPPSPFTGRDSTLIAVRVGRRSVQVEPAVIEAMDRLLAWDRRQPLSARDRVLVEGWLDELRVKMLGRLAASGKAVDCDDVCMLRHLTEGGDLFGRTKAEQQETRNELLLTALAAAVDNAGKL
jgi:hypothetical protein